jgi:hypothetical protein
VDLLEEQFYNTEFVELGAMLQDVGDLERASQV